jgi:dienelactone hydrolase
MPPATVDGPLPAVDAPPTPHPDAPATGADPAGSGALAFTSADASIPGAGSGRVLPSTIYTPTAAGPFPLVVISPGFQLARTQYASYAEHLASWGFVVVLTDYADQSLFASHQLMADDIPAVIDYTIARSTIDTTRIALAGHSLGGDVSVLAALSEPRVTAVLGWDPVDGNPAVLPMMQSFTQPLAAVGETTDGSGGLMPCAPLADDYQQFYAHAPSPALEMTLVGADHMSWVDDSSCSVCALCTAGSASSASVHEATRRMDVAWLRLRFYDDATMVPWLANPPEVAAGAATVEQK